jgi:hypothetical protein
MAFDTFRTPGKDRIIDATFLAAEIPGLPQCLSLQTRAFKLKPLFPTLRGRFLEPRIPLEDIWSRFLEEPSPVTDAMELENTPSPPPAFIGETISQVFAPFYFQKDLIFDGLGNRPLNRGRISDWERVSELKAEGIQAVRFLPTICPYCGADLQGEKDTQILPCRNCNRVWGIIEKKLGSVDFGVIESGNIHPSFFLPFWRIHLPGSLEGLVPRPLATTSAVRKNMGDPDGEKGDKGYYWLPAFKLSPSAFLIAARAMTVRQPPGIRLPQELPQGQYYPVNLPWEQAVEGLPVLFAHLTKSPIHSPEAIDGNLKNLEHLLVFVPFHLQGSELVQETLLVGISRAALHFGRFI